MGLVIEQTVFTAASDKPFATKRKWVLALLKLIEKITAKLLTRCVRKALGLSLILPDKDDILEKRFEGGP